MFSICFSSRSRLKKLRAPFSLPRNCSNQQLISLSKEHPDLVTLRAIVYEAEKTLVDILVYRIFLNRTHAPTWFCPLLR